MELMFNKKGQKLHEYRGKCLDRLCRLEFSIYLTSWEFKLLDIIECQRCGQDIPAGDFKEVIKENEQPKAKSL